MHPILARFGEVTFYTYGFVMMATLFLIYFLALKYRDTELLERADLADISLLVVFSIWFGGGLLWLLLSGEFSLTNLRHQLDPARLQNLTTLPVASSFFVLLAGYCRWKRLPFWRVLDFLVPFFVFGYALQRTFGCFSAGCCHGTPTTLPWGVTFGDTLGVGPPAGVVVHPTQLYMGFAGLASAYGLMRGYWRWKCWPGFVTGLGTVALFGVYFVVSNWRGDLTSEKIGLGLESSQIVSLLLTALGGSLCVVARWRARREPFEGEKTALND
ncbi:MAG: prolipoprotein diacylglyceryl transferase [Magnetococcus sp. YQC-9]